MRWALCLAAYFVALLGGTPALAQVQSELTGRYVVVAYRASSVVASTLVLDRPDPRDALIGASIDFDSPSGWFNDSICPGPWRAALAVEPLPWVDDPNLSDLQIGDSQENLSLVVDCHARPLSSIKQVLKVDDRVLVTSTSGGETYFILEKLLAGSEALALEGALRSAGYDPGAVDGQIDEMTRAAVAAIAEKQGAAYRFKTGVVTRNILALLTPTQN